MHIRMKFLLLWGRLMSKKINDDKGKKGERDLMKTIFKMEEAGEDIDIKKPTYTNEPDDGLDLEMKCGHNIGELMNAIIHDKEKKPVLSQKKIKVRIDAKNYGGRIGKPVADKFVADCEKNPQDAEHCLVGGERLTKGAKEVIEDSEHVCRYYSQEDINKVDNYYENELRNIVDNCNDGG